MSYNLHDLYLVDKLDITAHEVKALNTRVNTFYILDILSLVTLIVVSPIIKSIPLAIFSFASFAFSALISNNYMNKFYTAQEKLYKLEDKVHKVKKNLITSINTTCQYYVDGKCLCSYLLSSSSDLHCSGTFCPEKEGQLLLAKDSLITASKLNTNISIEAIKNTITGINRVLASYNLVINRNPALNEYRIFDIVTQRDISVRTDYLFLGTLDALIENLTEEKIQDWCEYYEVTPKRDKYTTVRELVVTILRR